MKMLLKYSALLLPLLLVGCDDSVQSTLGLEREAPDEFTVVSRPPLTVPPEFTLRPPIPGEAPLGTTPDARARSLITGQAKESPSSRDGAFSAGASSLLRRAGASEADATIRNKLTVDAATPVDTSNAKTLMEKLTGAEKNEPTVDAKKEAERLRANRDAGKPLTEGDVPEEKPQEKSLIDRIF